MSGRVQVEGADRLASTLGQFGRRLGDMSDPGTAAGDTIAAAAAARAPRRTGQLAGSARVAAGPKQVVVSWGVGHAAPLQWGVGARIGLRGPHNIRATYFATDALDVSEDQVVDAYADQVDRLLGQVKGA